MEYLQLIKSGERIALDFPIYAATFAIPAGALALLIAIPNVPGIIKQLLAIPLLIANILYPATFSSYVVLNFLAAPFCFTVNLRFLELFYIGPLLQDRSVYTSLYSLWVDFWSCLKTFPKSENNKKKDDKKSEIKVYENDKKYYHVLTSLLITIVFFDILSAWLSSFTPYDMITLEKEQPVLYLGFFTLVILFLTCGFNVAGYSFQLLYCIIIDKGSHSSEQWRKLMKDPIFSSSLDQLWSVKWHALFKSTWLPFPFRPVRDITQRLLVKSTKHYVDISIYMATISVFAMSGFMHEYMIFCNIGWPVYRQLFIGKQTVFFVLHGCGVVFEKIVKSLSQRYLPSHIYDSFPVRILKSIWLMMFGAVFFSIFFEGFLYWGVINQHPLQFSKPYIHTFVKTHPQLLPYFGSNI
ncbi:unnamed protein product [Cunninghamella echinulata]